MRRKVLVPLFCALLGASSGYWLGYAQDIMLFNDLSLSLIAGLVSGAVLGGLLGFLLR